MTNKIAFISEHASPLALLGGKDNGGQNVYVAEVARQLGEQGYQVDIFTRREDIISKKVNTFCQNVRVILVDAGPKDKIDKETLLPYMKDFRREMEYFIKRNKISYQLIHANFWMSGLVAMELKERLDIPFVITFHALGHIRKMHQKEMDRFPPERVDIERSIVQQADKIIAECPQDEVDLRTYYRADPDKMVMIPCGFSPDDFYPIAKSTAKKLLEIADNDKIVLQLGRMVERKGIDNVIQAFAKVKTDHQLRLIIVGGEHDSSENDPELERLKTLTRKYGIENSVDFVGQKNRGLLRYYYSAADIFITTPWYEPFGITPIEAMACGTPVIGSAVGGIKFTVKDGHTGYLVPPKQPEVLAEKIAHLLSEPSLLKKMSDNAVQHVHENFTWKKIALQLHNCYQGIHANQHKLREQEFTMIQQAFEEGARTFERTSRILGTKIALAGEMISRALKAGNKILVCGNGGSAAESQHFVAELVGRFEVPHRKGLPAMSLNADMAIITAWANDFGYDDVFARQVQAYGNQGDILLCMSTSGNSDNIIKAMQMAKKKGICCINMLGKDGGRAVDYGELNLIVPSNSTQRIQEMHLHLVHLLCTIIENRMFNVAFTNKTAAKEQSLPALYRPEKIFNHYGS
ncbi:glycosyltransferase [Pedobacter terrae]|uniref:glycosyltransferase n=1 Tax=Pedobacter terrae TaxID=405671 RepID=UPI002FFAED91